MSHMPSCIKPCGRRKHGCKMQKNPRFQAWVLGRAVATFRQMERERGMGGCLAKYCRMPFMSASASLAW